MIERRAYKTKIVSILTTAAGHPITANQIAHWAHINEDNDTSPKTRKLIRELINEGHVIGSNKDGYYLMSTGKEVQVYLNSLLQRQMAISKRIKAVYDSATEKRLL